MFEILVSLCLLNAPENCNTHRVPTHAADCEMAETLAAYRLQQWRQSYLVKDERCAEEEPGDMVFMEIVRGLFVHSGAIEDATPENAGDISNIAFVVGDKSIAVIDSGGSRQVGENLYRAIRNVSPLPISHLILTHMHPDHIFGATAIADAGAVVVGHSKLTNALASRRNSYETSMKRLMGDAFSGSSAPVIEMEIPQTIRIDLGNRVLRLDPWPLAHSAADLTVFDEATATLVAGDLLFNQHIPALDGSLRGWQAVMAELDALKPIRVVPGHGPPVLPWPEGTAAQSRYFNVLAKESRAAIDDGISLAQASEFIGKDEAENWDLFDLFNPRNATVVYTELEWE